MYIRTKHSYSGMGVCEKKLTTKCYILVQWNLYNGKTINLHIYGIFVIILYFEKYIYVGI